MLLARLQQWLRENRIFVQQFGCPSTERKLANLVLDSRIVGKDDVFIAIAGEVSHGGDFIDMAIANGAAVILIDEDYCLPAQDFVIPLVCCRQLRASLGLLAQYYYPMYNPELQLIGITGTNGKTSCCHFIAQLLQQLGKSCGIIGTIGQGIYPQLNDTKLTTQDVCTNYKIIQDLSQQANYIAMEVSSHALVQHRVAALRFAVAVFTNLTVEHLDYHNSLEEYFLAKRQLFYTSGLQYAVVNLDCIYGQRLADELSKLDAHQPKIIGYSNKIWDSGAKIPQNLTSYLCETVNGVVWYTPYGNFPYARLNLLGDFQISNLLAALTVTLILQPNLAESVFTGLQYIHAPPGRMQLLASCGTKPKVIVDYSHTPEGLVNALVACKKIVSEAGKMICIFGCGGDRCRKKRPLMLAAACEYADKIIITEDNSRTESFANIVKDMMAFNVEQYNISVIEDRQQAISKTIYEANSQDVVLIAGKGHERVLVKQDSNKNCSDIEIAQTVLDEYLTKV